MKKFLLYFAATVAGLALIVYVSATFFLGSIVKAGVNRIAPKLTQTRVVLDGATISPLTGSGTLTGLSVDNPPGWTEGRAFYLGSIHVAIQPSSFFKDHIVINEITIDGAEFAYETKIISSNINDLLKNIESATGGSKKPEATAANGQPLKFEVRHFRLTNSKVTIGVGVAALPLPMPPIELNNLGTTGGGITADQLAFAVMRSVTSGVVSATTQAAGQIGTTAGAAAIEGVKKTGEGIKKLFGGGK
jgi:uncharacterized protein involved in outer membrane biogenesis